MIFPRKRQRHTREGLVQRFGALKTQEVELRKGMICPLGVKKMR